MRVFTQLQAVATEDGRLVLEGLPLQKGQTVEVVLFTYEMDVKKVEPSEDPMVLRDEILIDRDPFDPVAADDWEAMQ